jgi:ketosteroid isomerase-like protein
MSHIPDVLDVVTRFYAATNAKRAADLPELVHHDVVFKGPAMQAHGAAQYIAMNEQLLGFHAGTKMLQQFTNGESVCSIYDLNMSTPAGGSLLLTIADWITVKDGKIAEQRIYFDPREFTKAFGM